MPRTSFLLAACLAFAANAACSGHDTVASTTPADPTPPQAPPPSSDADAAPAPPTGPALPAGISALAGHDPSLPDGDLAPFGALVGDATHVGLGESIHTSGGFHDVKFRLVKYLVEKKGFRLVSWEWQRTNAAVVDAYITAGTGSATAAAGGLSVWSSTSVRDMIAWLRSYNQAHPDDMVHFIGFDVQQPAQDLDALSAYLQANAPDEAASAGPGLQKCMRTYAATYDGDYAACMPALDSVAQYFDANTAALEAKTSHAALEGARIAWDGAHAWQDEIYYYSSDVRRSFEARDVAMADVLARETAVSYPTTKTIVWAHNYHLREKGADVTGTGAVGARTMGTAVRERLGARYLAVAVTGWDVSIDWPNVGCGAQPTPDADSIEGRLEALPGGTDLLVDLSFPGAQQPFFAGGQSYASGLYEELVPASQYQAIVFLRTSAAMTPLDWAKCSP